jgi:predicted MFS family arabinose efflux permease
MPIYAFAYFTPTILRTYGFSIVQTQLRTVPPMACALVVCLLTAYFSDRTRLRSPFIFSALILAIVGLVILVSVRNSFPVQYLGICMVAMGNFAAGTILLCWYIMNLRGHAGRSIGSAWMIGFGNTGAIIATFSFLAKDSPRYHTGYSLCIGSLCICVGSCAVYAALAWRQNRRLRAKGTGETDVSYYSM